MNFFGLSKGHFTLKNLVNLWQNPFVFKKNPSTIHKNPLVVIKFRTLFRTSKCSSVLTFVEEHLSELSNGSERIKFDVDMNEFTIIVGHSLRFIIDIVIDLIWFLKNVFASQVSACIDTNTFNICLVENIFFVMIVLMKALRSMAFLTS